jgi:hypothetical protein
VWNRNVEWDNSHFVTTSLPELGGGGGVQDL